MMKFSTVIISVLFMQSLQTADDFELESKGKMFQLLHW